MHSTALIPTLLTHPTRHLFFTGKGGVGKTSLSAATALALADAGKRVLLVSTDAASNLDEMLGVPLRNTPVAVPGAPGLWVLNIDPDNAAEAYRQRVLAQMQPAERAAVREQLSGACTTEIAAFDEFTALLDADPKGETKGETKGGSNAASYDHIVFDTAPTGHTLRLLSLPKAWTGFLAGNDRGASCLGPHSGLKMQEARFQAAMAALTDAQQTTVVLVARPDASTLTEAGRTSVELRSLGLTHQRLVINGVFHASLPDDAVACAIEAQGTRALANLPDALVALPRDEVPLRAFDTVGLSALRALLSGTHADPSANPSAPAEVDAGEGLATLADALSAAGHGLVMVMGKGGVGKTTVAAALALGLVERGHAVHLTTTDPAGHLHAALNGQVPGLRVDHIDPKVETARYIARMMAARGRDLDEAGKALLLEDLQSPCTEEVAVFHAFAHVVSEARSAFVVLDTAPTGHSLLLMDATGAYHRQMMRTLAPSPAGFDAPAPRKAVGRVITPLMRLQDATYTHVIVVTLPEVTPVSQAAALQADLRRAGIEPMAWVLNKSLVAAGTRDPLLAARLNGERRQMARIADGLAAQIYTVPWLNTPPIGVEALGRLAEPGARTSAAV
jgi:arsenite-transporting ATPase